MTRDPYTVLGVARSASADEIKRAFHKLAHKHHPDKGGDVEVFKEISGAYAQLKDRGSSGTSSSPYDNPYKESAPFRRTTFFDEASNFDAEFINIMFEQVRKQQEQQRQREQQRQSSAYSTWQEFVEREEFMRRQNQANHFGNWDPEPTGTPFEEALKQKQAKEQELNDVREAQKRWFRRFNR